MIIDVVLNRSNKEVKEVNISSPEVTKALEGNKQSSEKVKRSLVKTISWRVIGTLDTLILSWLIVGEVKTAAAIASVEFVSKMILYFFHERAWNNIKWGK
ncbi:DUF2061 domain-containing protein [Aestuariivivens sp. NBU2969]|uniref:DUF2061 domain-containing protein n=1 Tax=Aestuariivivens sp. NBU2969 TaxID=2873267 RepID=UPI001CC0B74F|nr:DUF2061 domain-containing protein [Aestuariivivens sp. NBU2969]